MVTLQELLRPEIIAPIVERARKEHAERMVLFRRFFGEVHELTEVKPDVIVEAK